MLFFPAGFISVCVPYPTFHLVLHIDAIKELFHMNIPEFNPFGKAHLPYFVASACALTAATIWTMVVLQSPDMFHVEMSIWQRLGWPFFVVYRMIQKIRHPERFRVDPPEGGTSFPESISRPFHIETLSPISHIFILYSEGWTGQT